MSDVDRVAAWATSTEAASGARLASAPTPPIPAGGSAPFTLTLPPAGQVTTAAYDVLPLSVEFGATRTHTFLPVHAQREYQQLSLAWLVPLTLDPDPQLDAAPSPERVKAWQAAVGSTSRLARLASAFAGRSVTYAVDASLLAPPRLAPPPANPGGSAGPSPSATPTPGEPAPVGPAPTSTPTPTGATADPGDPTITGLTPLVAEDTVRAAAAARLATVLTGTSPWVLPTGDPDVAALPAQPLGDERLGAARRVARTLGGRADVVWPVDPTWSAEAGARYAAQLASAPAGVVVGRDRLNWEVRLGDAGRRGSTGMPLLAASEALGLAAAAAVRPESAVQGRQEFLALTVGQLRESPGLARTVLVALPRDLDPDKATTSAFLTTIEGAPWLARTSAGAVLSQASAAAPVSEPRDVVGPPVPATPLVGTSLTRLEELHTRAKGAAAIRADRNTVRADWDRRITALDSARWRGHPDAFAAVVTGVTADLDASVAAVRVAPQTINFLADNGRLQVIVQNFLDVPVTGVRVRLVPDNPRLRITQDVKEVAIGARSRTTVTYDVTALAAGPVQIEARVTGPTGGSVGPTTTMKVRVSPTGNWVYWALGALAALALAGGLWRGRRERTRLASQPPPANAVQVDESGLVVEEPYGHPDGLAQEREPR